MCFKKSPSMLWLSRWASLSRQNEGKFACAFLCVSMCISVHAFSCTCVDRAFYCWEKERERERLKDQVSKVLWRPQREGRNQDSMRQYCFRSFMAIKLIDLTIGKEKSVCVFVFMWVAVERCFSSDLPLSDPKPNKLFADWWQHQT